MHRRSRRSQSFPSFEKGTTSRGTTAKDDRSISVVALGDARPCSFIPHGENKSLQLGRQVAVSRYGQATIAPDSHG